MSRRAAGLQTIVVVLLHRAKQNLRSCMESARPRRK